MHEEVRMSGINYAQEFQTQKRRIKQLFKKRTECKFNAKVPLQQDAISDYLVQNFVCANLTNNYQLDDYKNIIIMVSKIQLNNEYMTLDFIGWGIKIIGNGDNKTILNFFLLLLEMHEELKKFGYTWEVLASSRLRISILRNIYYNFKYKNKNKICKENYELIEKAFTIIGIEADRVFGIYNKDHINTIKALKNVQVNESHLQEENIKNIFSILNIPADSITIPKLDIIIKLFNMKKTKEINFIKDLHEKYCLISKQNIITDDFFDIIESSASNSENEQKPPQKNEEITIEPIEIETSTDNKNIVNDQNKNEEDDILEKLFSLIEGGIKHPRGTDDDEQLPNKTQKIDRIPEKSNEINFSLESPLIKFRKISPPCSPILWEGYFDDKNFPPTYQKLKQSL